MKSPSNISIKKEGVFVKEFNKKIPLELVLLDDESNMTLTVSRMESLYSSHNVVAYLGGFSSPIHAAQAPVAEKNKVPLLMVSTYLYSIHQKGYKYNFSPFPKSTDCAKGVFEYSTPFQQPKSQKKLPFSWKRRLWEWSWVICGRRKL